VPFAPRALLRQTRIAVELSPYELALLIQVLERRACQVADDPEMIDFAQHLFRRIAQLREASR
jgi:hypothetical protein